MSDDGTLQSSDAEGEIAIKGDLLMAGYLKQPDVTAQAMKDGWLRTGYIGAMDGNGYLYILVLLTVVIIFGGFYVYPFVFDHSLSSFFYLSFFSVFLLPVTIFWYAVHSSFSLRPFSFFFFFFLFF